MAEYIVKWEIEIDADSPLEACMKAREMQLDADSTATFFDVALFTEEPPTQRGNPFKTFDISTGEEHIRVHGRH